jgi:antitoxin HicB
MYDYAIRFEEDSAPGLAMFCRDLPELNSYGDDRESTINEALDAIETTLSIYVDQRRVIPVASAPEAGEHVVRLPAVTVAKIALWNAMMERDMRKADLCRLLGVHQAQGDRLVDFLHTSKIEQLEAALKAFDLRLSVTVQPYCAERMGFPRHR